MTRRSALLKLALAPFALGAAAQAVAARPVTLTWVVETQSINVINPEWKTAKYAWVCMVQKPDGTFTKWKGPPSSVLGKR